MTLTPSRELYSGCSIEFEMDSFFEEEITSSTSAVLLCCIDGKKIPLDMYLTVGMDTETTKLAFQPAIFSIFGTGGK